MNYIVYSEFKFEDYILTELEPTLIYLDCRRMSSSELECRWTTDKNTVFFLGNNGMPYLALNSLEQVWFYDKEAKEDDQYFCLTDFIDVEKFNLESSHDVYKHFRAGRFGGLKNFQCMKYKFGE